jgi:hypothetical protein
MQTFKTLLVVFLCIEEIELGQLRVSELGSTSSEKDKVRINFKGNAEIQREMLHLHNFIL